MTTCTVDGCTNKHRAKGLCSTHYNQGRYPNRWRTIEVPCGYCGQPTTKTVQNNRRARFCSLICRDLYRLDETNGDPFLGHRGPPPLYGPPAPKTPPTPRTCAECGTEYTGRRFRYCSPGCLNRATQRAKRQRRRGRRSIRRTEIFQRDGWICHLCGYPCDPDATVPDFDAATVDHILPQSLYFGPPSVVDHPANLATAHFLCNSLRGDDPLDPSDAPLYDALRQVKREILEG